MISRALEAKILRLHHAEKWPVGTIAAQLGIHHNVVERVLRQDGLPRARRQRGSLIDPYLSFITETWNRYPKLTAARLHRMCQERGYHGAKDHFRHLVAPLRPKPRAEAYLRLQTLPGDQAQVDWAHFGRLEIGRARRSLVAFVCILSWSRAVFVRFYLGQQSENFLRGHIEAFERWGGVPRVLLYDNLKSAVLERSGEAIRFNPLLLDFAAHYRFEPRPVAPARGNEKGRVERIIRFLRRDFFIARKFADLADLNRMVDDWTRGSALQRPCPGGGGSIAEAFAQERSSLMALPDNPFPIHERHNARVGKTPYVRFDLNDYSVPHGEVRKTVEVVATPELVRILRNGKELARHLRSYGRGEQIEIEAHIRDLVEAKRWARKARGLDRLAQAAPSSTEFLKRIAARQLNLRSTTAALVELLDRYGPANLEAALAEVLKLEAPHLHGVRHVLERERQRRGLPPPMPLPLPDDLRLRNLTVRPHPLAGYDELGLDQQGGDDAQQR